VNVADFVGVVQAFLDFYIVGETPTSRAVFGSGAGGGIRHRTPAVVDGPPEYTQLPNGLDQTPFRNGEGPEPFDEPLALYLDCCPLERAQVRSDGVDGLEIELFFVVRFAPGRFDPSVSLPVCLPSGEELCAIANECVNRVRDYLGTDALIFGSGDDQSPYVPIATTLRVMDHDDFLRLELP
jgi:hypothetical protein